VPVQAGELLTCARFVTASKIDSLRALLRDERGQLAIVFAIVFVSRLPFLDAGYGVNTDAWRIAQVAREIASTGEYSTSRFPGFPVQEIVCSWCWRGGPFALNALSTIFSAIAVTAFAAVARKFNGHWFVAALALAATPIVFISSVTAKDYVWALAFNLLALLSALQKQAVIAGMFVGLATGCRITSFSLLLPIAVILSSRNDRLDITSVAKLLTAAILSATMAFSPVWLRYGTGFWRFYEHARPNWLTVLSRGTIEVWGTLGLIGIALAASLGSVRALRDTFRSRDRARPSITSCQDSWIIAGVVLWIAITVALYLRLPDQAGYLLPAIPASLLLMQQFASGRAFQIICACLILSPFFNVSRKGIRPGAIFLDQAERLRTLQQVQEFLGYAETLPGHNTIVVGAWEPIISTVAPSVAAGRNHYVYLLDKQALERVLARHEPILYAPRMREFNQRIYGIDLAKYGGIDLSDVYRHGSRPREGL